VIVLSGPAIAIGGLFLLLIAHPSNECSFLQEKINPKGITIKPEKK
jgi:hypothetical protein